MVRLLFPFLGSYKEATLYPSTPPARILWCKYWLYFVDWHSVQYVSGHSCVNPLYSISMKMAAHSFFYPRVFVWDYDLFRDNIRYDLLRTGNVGRSTEKILERGFLDAVGTIRSVSQSSSEHTEHSRQLHIIRFTPEQLTVRLPLQDM